jgi:hypothetical protein
VNERPPKKQGPKQQGAPRKQRPKQQGAAQRSAKQPGKKRPPKRSGAKQPAAKGAAARPRIEPKRPAQPPADVKRRARERIAAQKIARERAAKQSQPALAWERVKGSFGGLGVAERALVGVGALIIVVAIVGALSTIGGGDGAPMVTPDAVAQIQLGQGESEVREILGDPDETSTVNVPPIGESDCWYYDSDTDSGEVFRLCFRGGEVAVKAAP